MGSENGGVTVKKKKNYYGNNLGTSVVLAPQLCSCGNLQAEFSLAEVRSLKKDAATQASCCLNRCSLCADGEDWGLNFFLSSPWLFLFRHFHHNVITK